jgi:hypothetical protein
VEPGPLDAAICEPLVRCFDDQEASVAGSAALVFRHPEIMRSECGPELAIRFVRSRQFNRDPDDLMFPLSEFAGDLLPYQPVLAGVIERATTDMSSLNGDMQRAGYRFADRASECVLRIYERAQGREYKVIREWCLDQLDALVESGDSWGEGALERLGSDG